MEFTIECFSGGASTNRARITPRNYVSSFPKTTSRAPIPMIRQANPDDAADQNAAHLLSTDIFDWLWTFSALQIQCLSPPAKTDRRHFDGGASTGLHLALTLSGRRSVRCFWEGVEDVGTTYLQRSGSLYVAWLGLGQPDIFLSFSKKTI